MHWGVGRKKSLSQVREGPATNIQTIHNYRPKPYNGRVILFRADHQPLGIRPDPEMGWRSTLTGDFEVHQVPGYHDSLLFSPRLEILATLLRGALSQSD